MHFAKIAEIEAAAANDGYPLDFDVWLAEEMEFADQEGQQIFEYEQWVAAQEAAAPQQKQAA